MRHRSPVSGREADSLAAERCDFAVGRGTQARWASYLGEYRKVFAGYAADDANRERAASGGAVTTLLTTALRDGLVEGVAVARADFSAGAIGYRFDVVTDPERVREYGSSAYFNIPIEKHWADIEAFGKSVALCALPCHARILDGRVASGRGPENIDLVVSLFCGHNNEPDLLGFVFEREGIPASDVADMRVDRTYLGGTILVSMVDGSLIRLPFRHFNVYRSLNLFGKPMCRYCDDHLGDTADISIGDIFLPEYREKDVKHSAVVARSRRGLELVESAIQRNILVAEEIDPFAVVRAQKRVLVPSGDIRSRYVACRLAGYPVKRPSGGRLRLRSLLTFTLLLWNDRLAHTGLGRAILRRTPRPLLYVYIGFIKLVNHSLGYDEP